MYKLTAKLDNGLRFITNSTQIADLQRIAANLQAKGYQITNRAGEVVFSLAYKLEA